MQYSGWLRGVFGACLLASCCTLSSASQAVEKSKDAAEDSDIDARRLAKVESLVTELRSPERENVAESDSVWHEVWRLKQDHADLCDRLSNKYVSWASYVLVAITLGAAMFTSVLAYFSYTSRKEVRDRISEAQCLVEEEASRRVAILGSEIDTRTRLLDSLSRHFIHSMETKGRLMTKLVSKWSESIGDKAKKSEIESVLDEIFREELCQHSLQSYIADLASPDEQEKIIGIWAIEAMGCEENLADLQAIVDDEHESAEVRLQAQVGVERLRATLERQRKLNSNS